MVNTDIVTTTNKRKLIPLNINSKKQVIEDVVIPATTPLISTRLAKKMSPRKKDLSDSDFNPSDSEDDMNPFEHIPSAPHNTTSVATTPTLSSLIQVEKRGMIIVPPVFKSEFNVDEIAHLADQDEATITSNLWFLVCNVVYDSINKDELTKKSEEDTTKKNKSTSTVGKSMTKNDRFQLYYIKMEEALLNYPLRSDGNAVLQYFQDIGSNALS